MTSRTPIYVSVDGLGKPTELAEFESTDVVPVINGGTGVASLVDFQLELSSLVALQNVSQNGQLMVRKSTTQTTTTSWADVANFDTVDVSGGDVEFTLSTGVVGIATTGLYRIGYNFLGENTANARAGLEAKFLIDTGGGYADLPQSISGSYSRLDDAQDFGTCSCESYLINLNRFTTLKCQIQHTTQALTVTGYISLERLN